MRVSVKQSQGVCPNCFMGMYEYLRFLIQNSFFLEGGAMSNFYTISVEFLY